MFEDRVMTTEDVRSKLVEGWGKRAGANGSWILDSREIVAHGDELMNLRRESLPEGNISNKERLAQRRKKMNGREMGGKEVRHGTEAGVGMDGEISNSNQQR